ncbi:MAG: hypothetical protein QXG65_02590 [Thermoplasmata archaeon]
MTSISPQTVVLLLFSVAAAGVAVALPSSVTVGEAAGAVAIALALLAGASHYLASRPVDGSAPASVDVEPTYHPLGSSEIETALRGGPFEREAVVLALDSIERNGPKPDLPSTPVAEMRRVTHLPAEEFRAYLEGRIRAIEREI